MNNKPTKHEEVVCNFKVKNVGQYFLSISLNYMEWMK